MSSDTYDSTLILSLNASFFSAIIRAALEQEENHRLFRAAGYPTHTVHNTLSSSTPSTVSKPFANLFTSPFIVVVHVVGASGIGLPGQSRLLFCSHQHSLLLDGLCSPQPPVSFTLPSLTDNALHLLFCFHSSMADPIRTTNQLPPPTDSFAHCFFPIFSQQSITRLSDGYLLRIYPNPPPVPRPPPSGFVLGASQEEVDHTQDPLWSERVYEIERPVAGSTRSKPGTSPSQSLQSPFHSTSSLQRAVVETEPVHLKTSNVRTIPQIRRPEVFEDMSAEKDDDSEEHAKPLIPFYILSRPITTPDEDAFCDITLPITFTCSSLTTVSSPSVSVLIEPALTGLYDIPQIDTEIAQIMTQKISRQSSVTIQLNSELLLHSETIFTTLSVYLQQKTQRSTTLSSSPQLPVKSIADVSSERPFISFLCHLFILHSLNGLPLPVAAINHSLLTFVLRTAIGILKTLHSDDSQLLCDYLLPASHVIISTYFASLSPESLQRGVDTYLGNTEHLVPALSKDGATRTLLDTPLNQIAGQTLTDTLDPSTVDPQDVSDMIRSAASLWHYCVEQVISGGTSLDDDPLPFVTNGCVSFISTMLSTSGPLLIILQSERRRDQETEFFGQTLGRGGIFTLNDDNVGVDLDDDISEVLAISSKREDLFESATLLVGSVYSTSHHSFEQIQLSLLGTSCELLHNYVQNDNHPLHHNAVLHSLIVLTSSFLPKIFANESRLLVSHIQVSVLIDAFKHCFSLISSILVVICTESSVISIPLLLAVTSFFAIGCATECRLFSTSFTHFENQQSALSSFINTFFYSLATIASIPLAVSAKHNQSDLSPESDVLLSSFTFLFSSLMNSANSLFSLLHIFLKSSHNTIWRFLIQSVACILTSPILTSLPPPPTQPSNTLPQLLTNNLTTSDILLSSPQFCSLLQKEWQNNIVQTTLSILTSALLFIVPVSSGPAYTTFTLLLMICINTPPTLVPHLKQIQSILALCFQSEHIHNKSFSRFGREIISVIIALADREKKKLDQINKTKKGTTAKAPGVKVLLQPGRKVCSKTEWVTAVTGNISGVSFNDDLRKLRSLLLSLPTLLEELGRNVQSIKEDWSERLKREENSIVQEEESDLASETALSSRLKQVMVQNTPTTRETLTSEAEPDDSLLTTSTMHLIFGEHTLESFKNDLQGLVVSLFLYDAIHPFTFLIQPLTSSQLAITSTTTTTTTKAQPIQSNPLAALRSRPKAVKTVQKPKLQITDEGDVESSLFSFFACQGGTEAELADSLCKIVQMCVKFDDKRCLDYAEALMGLYEMLDNTSSGEIPVSIIKRIVPIRREIGFIELKRLEMLTRLKHKKEETRKDTLELFCFNGDLNRTVKLSQIQNLAFPFMTALEASTIILPKSLDIARKAIFDERQRAIEEQDVPFAADTPSLRGVQSQPSPGPFAALQTPMTPAPTNIFLPLFKKISDTFSKARQCERAMWMESNWIRIQPKTDHESGALNVKILANLRQLAFEVRFSSCFYPRFVLARFYRVCEGREECPNGYVIDSSVQQMMATSATTTPCRGAPTVSDFPPPQQPFSKPPHTHLISSFVYTLQYGVSANLFRKQIEKKCPGVDVVVNDEPLPDLPGSSAIIRLNSVWPNKLNQLPGNIFERYEDPITILPSRSPQPMPHLTDPSSAGLRENLEAAQYDKEYTSFTGYHLIDDHLVAQNQAFTRDMTQLPPIVGSPTSLSVSGGHHGSPASVHSQIDTPLSKANPEMGPPFPEPKRQYRRVQLSTQRPLPGCHLRENVADWEWDVVNVEQFWKETLERFALRLFAIWRVGMERLNMDQSGRLKKDLKIESMEKVETVEKGEIIALFEDMLYTVGNEKPFADLSKAVREYWSKLNTINAIIQGEIPATLETDPVQNEETIQQGQTEDDQDRDSVELMDQRKVQFSIKRGGQLWTEIASRFIVLLETSNKVLDMLDSNETLMIEERQKVSYYTSCINSLCELMPLLQDIIGA